MAGGYPVDPSKLYQVNGQVYPIKAATISVGVSVHNPIINGVSGTKIRIMGAYMIAAAGVSNVSLTDGSGGTIIINCVMPAYTVGYLLLPVIDSGYGETSTGNGLYADISITAAIVNIFYIQYTP